MDCKATFAVDQPPIPTPIQENRCHENLHTKKNDIRDNNCNKKARQSRPLYYISIKLINRLGGIKTLAKKKNLLFSLPNHGFMKHASVIAPRLISYNVLSI